LVNTPPTVSDTHHGTPDADNIVPDVHHDVLNTHPIGFEVQSEIVNTRTTASDTHRNKLNSREDVDGQKQAVSITRIFIVTQYPLTTA
jgi:hypothetical protein